MEDAPTLASKGSRRDPVQSYLDQLSPSSQKSQLQALRRIASALSGKDVDPHSFDWGSLSYTDAARLSAWLSKGFATATARRYMAALRMVAREAWRLNLMPHERYDRIRDLRAPRGRPRRPGRRLTRAEVARLLEPASPTDHFEIRAVGMAAVLVGTGCRVAELSGMERADYDPQTGALYVARAKGGRPRQMVLPEELRPAVAAWLLLSGDGDAHGPLFYPLGRTGRPLPRRFSIPGIVDALHRHCQRRGVIPCNPHRTRHFFASEMHAAGVDPIRLQRLLGHVSLSSTARYVADFPGAAPPAADGLWADLTGRAALRLEQEDAA